MFLLLFFYFIDADDPDKTQFGYFAEVKVPWLRDYSKRNAEENPLADLCDDKGQSVWTQTDTSAAEFIR